MENFGIVEGQMNGEPYEGEGEMDMEEEEHQNDDS